jgi:hypothetical protein
MPASTGVVQDVHARFDRRAHHRRSRRHRHRLTIDIERHVDIRVTQRRAVIGVVEGIAQFRLAGAIAGTAVSI